MAETKQANGFTVQKYTIIGTSHVVYDVWEYYDGHSTMRSQDGGCWLGRLGTRKLTPDLDALPAWSQERSDAVGAFHDHQYEQAYVAIVETFPEAAAGRRQMGSIEVSG
jgi:hypothetical protein